MRMRMRMRIRIRNTAYNAINSSALWTTARKNDLRCCLHRGNIIGVVDNNAKKCSNSNISTIRNHMRIYEKSRGTVPLRLIKCQFLFRLMITLIKGPLTRFIWAESDMVKYIPYWLGRSLLDRSKILGNFFDNFIYKSLRGTADRCIFYMLLEQPSCNCFMSLSDSFDKCLNDHVFARDLSTVVRELVRPMPLGSNLRGPWDVETLLMLLPRDIRYH